MASPDTEVSVDTYIAAFPPEVRILLDRMRETIRKIAPDATETIKYGVPSYVLGENLVHFAGYPSHIGLYPGPSAIVRFADELAGYKTARGSVQFPIARPLPLDLVARIVAFRIAEAQARAVGKRKRR